MVLVLVFESQFQRFTHTCVGSGLVERQKITIKRAERNNNVGPISWRPVREKGMWSRE